MMDSNKYIELVNTLKELSKSNPKEWFFVLTKSLLSDKLAEQIASSKESEIWNLLQQQNLANSNQETNLSLVLALMEHVFKNKEEKYSLALSYEDRNSLLKEVASEYLTLKKQRIKELSEQSFDEFDDVYKALA